MMSHGVIRWSGLFMNTNMNTISVKSTRQVTDTIPCKGAPMESPFDPDPEDVARTARWVLENRVSKISGPVENHLERYLSTEQRALDRTVAEQIHIVFGWEVPQP